MALFVPLLSYTQDHVGATARPFFGFYIGRDGPPGADYYTVPSLLAPGNLLKFYYLHDGDPEDIEAVSTAIDLKTKTIDVNRLLDYGGSKFIQDLDKMTKSAAISKTFN